MNRNLLLVFLGLGAFVAVYAVTKYAGSSPPRVEREEPKQASEKSHAGMIWVPGGEFTMGSDDHGLPNERPARRVRVDGFWMEEQTVTNADFRRFVEATNHVTTAERKPDWEEMRKQLPPDTPKPDDSKLVAGSLVFTPSPKAVPLDNLAGWWRWVPGANWRHPEGPDSNIDGKDS